MTKTEAILEKLAKTYPMSRAYITAANTITGGVSGNLANRALQGKKNTGLTGSSAAERDVLKHMHKDDTGSHPVARAARNPYIAGGVGAALGVTGSYAGLAATKKMYTELGRRIPSAYYNPRFVALLKSLELKNNLRMLPRAALVNGVGLAGIMAATNWAHARALKGRAQIGREGWGMKEKELLKQLKNKHD